jgi:REP element-mobilizing transposase RayT
VGYDLTMSYTNLLYHIVYGTKDRLPLITKELRPDLHRFLGGLVNDLHGTPLEINGVADHVHVLARIKPVISISEFLSKFKSQHQVGPIARLAADSNGRSNTVRSL